VRQIEKRGTNIYRNVPRDRRANREIHRERDSRHIKEDRLTSKERERERERERQRERE
jgi:hypothetical protein